MTKIDTMIAEVIKKGKKGLAEGTETGANFALALYKIYTDLYKNSMTPEEFFGQVDKL